MGGPYGKIHALPAFVCLGMGAQLAENIVVGSRPEEIAVQIGDKTSESRLLFFFFFFCFNSCESPLRVLVIGKAADCKDSAPISFYG